MNIEVLDDADAVALRAAETLVEVVEEARADQRPASVALSGGSTPRRLFRILADVFRGRVDWERVRIFFGDERNVAADHEDSNYRTARELLLSKVPIREDRIHRMEAAGEEIDRGAASYEEALRRFLPRANGDVPVLDLVWLGMGDDGHTASLFPLTRALEVVDRWVVVNEVPQLGTRRMTLTFPLLNAARRVQFLVTGRGKAAIVQDILGRDILGGESGRAGLTYPAARVLPASGQLDWLLDREAAAELKADG